MNPDEPRLCIQIWKIGIFAAYSESLHLNLDSVNPKSKLNQVVIILKIIILKHATINSH